MTGIEKAVQQCGSQHKLAELIGVSAMAVSKWVKSGLIPPARVIHVEKLTGIDRTELNPDIYPADDQAA